MNCAAFATAHVKPHETNVGYVVTCDPQASALGKHLGCQIARKPPCT
jgi:hypothetical protein